LVWGDGYFKGREEDLLENEQSQRGCREEDQQLRRKILGELQALVGSSEDDAAASSGLDYVTDTEWFYLVSMSYSFAWGHGYAVSPLEAHPSRCHCTHPLCPMHKIKLSYWQIFLLTSLYYYWRSILSSHHHKVVTWWSSQNQQADGNL
jgi:hypothetical protein